VGRKAAAHIVSDALKILPGQPDRAVGVENVAFVAALSRFIRQGDRTMR
jgi:hypothetical protein